MSTNSQRTLIDKFSAEVLATSKFSKRTRDTLCDGLEKVLEDFIVLQRAAPTPRRKEKVLYTPDNLPEAIGDIQFRDGYYFIGEKGVHERKRQVRKSKGMILLYLINHIGRKASVDRVARATGFSKATVGYEIQFLLAAINSNSVVYQMVQYSGNNRQPNDSVRWATHNPKYKLIYRESR